MIDRATVERIKNTADIVDVVSDYVHLVRRGANYMGLCPFHNERTPSFSVNKQRNFCYCFSCKKGGSPVNFIMEKEGLSYHEALLHLARKYGIEVVERELTDEERERQSAREAMFVANEWAMRKMQDDMTGTDEGRDVGLQYFTQRGVTDEAIKAFHLGYALDRGNALTEAAKKAGFRIEVLKQLGLVGTSQQGRDYDRFRGRVIFPILNTAGKVIAFGGRDLKGGLAKYINSPESELYKKSNELYGIHQAKSAIVSEGKCFLVEGYMDVIGMWQSGMKNVVASSGTALTDGQIAMIHRFTENITLIYDGDAAGIKASLRGIDMLLSHKLNVKVLLLPDGDDPDSFARKHTPEEFRKYVEDHETDIIRYKAQVMLNTVKKDPQTRIAAVNSVVESIAHIPDQVSRDVYVQECSGILGMPEQTIAKSVAKARAALVDKIRRERTRREYSISSVSAPASERTISTAHQVVGSSEDQSPDISVNSASDNAEVSPDLSSANPTGSVTRPQDSPLYPLEYAVIKYCVRYAFLHFCDYVDEAEPGLTEQGKMVSLNVLQYVAEELADSEMSFSIPIFNRVFTLLNDMKPDFDAFLNARTAELDENLEKLRTEGYDRIRNMDISVAEINREEKKLEDDITARRSMAIRELTKDYPGRILGSHEDEQIRQLALELIFEKHHLSNIYLKDGNTESEEDRLNMLLVRAIDEWKNELINLRIKDLFQKFRQIAGKGDTVLEQKLQAELAQLMNMRSEMAKCIGERIILNRR